MPEWYAGKLQKSEYLQAVAVVVGDAEQRRIGIEREHGGPVTFKMAAGYCKMVQSAQLPGGLFQQGPRLLAIFCFPIRVEASLLQDVAEWRRVRIVEGDAFLLQRARQVVIELGHRVALPDGAFVEACRDLRLDVVRHAAPGAVARHDPGAIPDVVGPRTEFLNLVELGRLGNDQRVFLSVDNAGLQRRVDIGKIDAGRRGAKRLEQGHVDLADRNANLETFQIGRIPDRFLAGGDLPKAVVPDFFERIELRLLETLANERAELAVHRGPDSIGILESEARSIDGGDRYQRREDQSAGGKEIDGSGAHLRQQIAVAAELAVREHADIDLAAGVLPDPGGGLDRECIHGMGGGEPMAEFPRIVCRHRARDIRHREAGAAQARNNRSTRQDHARDRRSAILASGWRSPCHWRGLRPTGYRRRARSRSAG